MFRITEFPSSGCLENLSDYTVCVALFLCQPTRNRYTSEISNIYATQHSELKQIRNSYNEEDYDFYSPPPTTPTQQACE